MLGSLLHTERPRPAPQRSQDRQLREGSTTPAKTLAQELLLRLSQRPGRLGEAQSPTSPRELESPPRPRSPSLPCAIGTPLPARANRVVSGQRA